MIPAHGWACAWVAHEPHNTCTQIFPAPTSDSPKFFLPSLPVPKFFPRSLPVLEFCLKFSLRVADTRCMKTGSNTFVNRAEAEALADRIQADDADWTYTASEDEVGTFVVVVFDESGAKVGTL